MAGRQRPFSCVFEGTVILGAQQPQTSSSGDLELACVGQAPRLALARSGFWVTDEEDRKLRQVWRGVGPRPTSAWMAVSRAGPAIVIEEARRWASLRHQSPDSAGWLASPMVATTQLTRTPPLWSPAPGVSDRSRLLSLPCGGIRSRRECRPVGAGPPRARPRRALDRR